MPLRAQWEAEARAPLGPGQGCGPPAALATQVGGSRAEQRGVQAQEGGGGDLLWEAIERQIPDVRQRAKVTLVGTPLTHERFLRRERGSYGPFLSATDGMLPMQGTGCAGFFCCGDSTFPGIGMPAAAASGLIAANSVVSVAEHWKMLDKIRF